MRWWDGVQWTDATQGAAVSLRAPEGTSLASPWIWLIVLLPLLPTFGLLFIDWQDYLQSVVTQPNSLTAQFAIYTNPAYLASVVGALVLNLLSILWAYLDAKRLAANGVPKPFSWAYIFFTFAGAGSWVYLIGRTVVLRRRTGRSAMGPIWAAIATVVVGFGIGIVVVVQVLGATAALVN